MASADCLVASWYNANVNAEDKRLDAGRLEYAVTMRSILDIINELQGGGQSKPLRIADIGCGTGRYGWFLVKIVYFEADRGLRLSSNSVGPKRP